MSSWEKWAFPQEVEPVPSPPSLSLSLSLFLFLFLSLASQERAVIFTIPLLLIYLNQN